MKTTMQLIPFSLCIQLLLQTVWGIHFPFERNFDDNSVSTAKIIEEPVETLFSSNESSEIHNASMYRIEDANTEYSQILTNENSSLTDQNNSTLLNGNQSLYTTYSTNSVSGTSNIPNLETLTAIFSNESHSKSSTQFSSSESSAATNEETKSNKNSSILTTSSNIKGNETSSASDDDEPEGVARGKPSTTESTSTTTSQPQTLYERTWALISDAYTLSILVPVAAGVVFASTIILTIATCRCLRRRCLHRRLRKKTLPDSVKNLRPSDRARLLAESSDEEF